MDRCEIPILNLVFHVNPGNEESITWLQGCTHSQQHLSRLYWTKTQHPWLKTTHLFPTPTDVIVIKVIPSLSSWGQQAEVSPCKKKEADNKQIRKNKQTKPAEQVIPCLILSWKILSGIIVLKWHQQELSFPCLLVIIIKWCHMMTWNGLQHRYGSH